MHGIYNICECQTLVRQEFLELVSRVTVNPVAGRTTCDGLADLGEIFGCKAQLPGIPCYFPLLTAMLLYSH